MSTCSGNSCFQMHVFVICLIYGNNKIIRTPNKLWMQIYLYEFCVYRVFLGMFYMSVLRPFVNKIKKSSLTMGRGSKWKIGGHYVQFGDLGKLWFVTALWSRQIWIGNIGIPGISLLGLLKNSTGPR